MSDVEWEKDLQFVPTKEDDELVSVIAYEIYQAMWDNLETMAIAETLAQLQKANGADPKKEMPKLFADAKKEFMANFKWDNYRVKGEDFLKSANERMADWQKAAIAKIK